MQWTAEAGVQKVETADACREIRDFLSKGIYQIMGLCKYVSLLLEPQEQHPRGHDTDTCVLGVCELKVQVTHIHQSRENRVSGTENVCPF